MAGIGPATSPLPRECSTTEPHGQFTASACCRTRQNDDKSTTDTLRSITSNMERETGIEPASLAWKAKVLPLNYSRIGFAPSQSQVTQSHIFALVEEAGFEPA